MATSFQKSQLKRSNFPEKIKVEGNRDEGQKVIVLWETTALKWKGFESRMTMWSKIYERI